jgi:hypothetical protein
LLERARLPTGGRSTDEIAAEAAPLLPLLDELSDEVRVGGDFESFQFRECFTVLSLLGRRLALLDLTPTAALQIVRLTVRSVDGFDDRPPKGFAERAVDAATEGFVLGREERIAELAEARAAKHLRPLRISDDAIALILSGVHEPSVLSECADALGRSMLAADIDIAIVDLSQLGEANRERATALFAADEVARMLGGICIFTGMDPRWAAAAAEARIPVDAMYVAPTLAAAIDSARERRGRGQASSRTGWRALLKRLRG